MKKKCGKEDGGIDCCTGCWVAVSVQQRNGLPQKADFIRDFEIDCRGPPIRDPLVVDFLIQQEGARMIQLCNSVMVLLLPTWYKARF